MPITIDPRVNFGVPNGGALFYRVLDAADSVLVARSSTNVQESPVGSGVYHVSQGIAVDPILGQTIFWDDGVSFAIESLDHYVNDVVTAQTLGIMGTTINTMNTVLGGLSANFGDFSTNFDTFASSTNSSLDGLTNITNAIGTELTSFHTDTQTNFTSISGSISGLSVQLGHVKDVTDILGGMIVDGAYTVEALANIPSTGGGGLQRVHVLQGSLSVSQR